MSWQLKGGIWEFWQKIHSRNPPSWINSLDEIDRFPAKKVSLRSSNKSSVLPLRGSFLYRNRKCTRTNKNTQAMKTWDHLVWKWGIPKSTADSSFPLLKLPFGGYTLEYYFLNILQLIITNIVWIVTQDSPTIRKDNANATIYQVISTIWHHKIPPNPFTSLLKMKHHKTSWNI